MGQDFPSYAKLNGADADYMVTSTGNGGNGLAITGPATVGNNTSRYLWKDGLDAEWAARTAGNNIIQIEYDYFTGPATTSNNGGGVELYDVTYNKYLGGLTMHQATKNIYGFSMDQTATPAAPQLVNLGTGTANVALPANTWVRLGFAYNATNGNVTYKGPGFYKTVANVVDAPHEIDFAVQNLAGTNTANSINSFDNLVVKAVATESIFLATSDVSLEADGIDVYPNPATDFLNVTAKTKILSVYIYDMSGVRVNAKIVDGKVDVKNLQTGTYLLGLKTEKGLVTKKFVKK